MKTQILSCAVLLLSACSYGQMLHGKIAEADSVAIRYIESSRSTGGAK